MKKKIFFAGLCLSLTMSLTYADDFSSVLKGIKSGVNAFSEIKNQGSNPIPTNLKNNLIMNDSEQIQSDTLVQKPVNVSFFAGLKPDSSILDVINAFKKYDSVTNINIMYGDKAITENNKQVNFKTVYIDKTILTKYLEQTIPDGLYHQRYGHKLADYTEVVKLSNGTQGKTMKLTSNILVEIDKMYIDGIPCQVRVLFKPSKEYYSLYPDKVFVGTNKNIAYSFVIETITFDTNFYDTSVQTIAKNNRENILNKYIEKYGVIRGNDCYEGQHCNDFVAVRFSPNFGIIYKNYLYIEEVNSKYNDFKVNSTIQESQKFDSRNDI